MRRYLFMALGLVLNLIAVKLLPGTHSIGQLLGAILHGTDHPGWLTALSLIGTTEGLLLVTGAVLEEGDALTYWFRVEVLQDNPSCSDGWGRPHAMLYLPWWASLTLILGAPVLSAWLAVRAGTYVVLLATFLVGFWTFGVKRRSGGA